MKNDLTIIYSTCDKYDCLWDGFFKLLEKYWPSCDMDIILNTETKSFHGKTKLNISGPLNCKKNITWSQRLLLSLDKVKTEFVLCFLDDFYIKSPVNTTEIEKCICRMKKDSSIVQYTFANEPGPNYSDNSNDIFERRGRFATYRINAQICLWRKDYLKKY